MALPIQKSSVRIARIRIHDTLRVTSAMEAGLAESPMEIRDIALLTEENT